MELVQLFMNLSLPYQILSVIVLLGLLAVFILYVTGVGYSANLIMKDKKYEDYSTTQKNLMKMATVLNIIMLICVVCYGIYLVYKGDFSKFYQWVDKAGNSVKSLASSILTEKDELLYDAKCDKLFASDPGLNSQYLGMKSSRPISEVRNLCGNYAKNILGRKV